MKKEGGGLNVLMGMLWLLRLWELQLLREKRNCEGNVKNLKKKKREERKEARVLWLKISECHGCLRSGGLLIFASVSFN